MESTVAVYNMQESTKLSTWSYGQSQNKKDLNATHMTHVLLMQ